MIKGYATRVRRIGSLLVLSAAFAAASAMAQTFPSRPITFVYPYAAGGGADTTLRLMSAEASRTLGQPIVLEARPGANGHLGIQAMQANRGQGHMICMVSNALVVTEPLRDPGFNVQPGRDYTPVLAAFQGGFVFVASPAAPFRDVPGMIAYAKANPGKLNWGQGTPGSVPHFAMLIANDRLGTDFTPIFYKGEPLIFNALLAGEVHVTLGSLAIKAQIDAGKVVPLAVTTQTRMASLPNVPTAIEAGIPFISGMVFWVGIVAPPEVPRDQALKLNRSFADSLKTPEVLKAVAQFNYQVLSGSPEDLNNLIVGELDKFRPLMAKMKDQVGGN